MVSLLSNTRESLLQYVVCIKTLKSVHEVQFVNMKSRIKDKYKNQTMQKRTTEIKVIFDDLGRK